MTAYRPVVIDEAMTSYDPALFRGTAWYYARYRPPYPVAVFALLIRTFAIDGRGWLLDLGAGTGEVAVPLSTHFEQVVAVEPDVEMIGEGEARARSAGAGNIRWEHTAAEEFSGRPAAFRITAVGTALHWMDKPRVLTRVHKLLEPGGGLAVISGGSLWTGRTAWQSAAVQVIQRYLGQARRAGCGEFRQSTGPYAELLISHGFVDPETHLVVQRIEWSVDQIIGYLYSTSFASRRLFGARVRSFEDELRYKLLTLDATGTFTEERTLEVIVARKES
jgi:ubiquinone/menaquinone biosynthesis C-methylase UbiE